MAKKQNYEDTLDYRLVYALRVRRLTATELSRLTDIPFSSISGYLSGKYTPKIATICKIATAIGVSINWLVGNLPIDAIDTPDYIPIDDGREQELLQNFRSLNYDGQNTALNIIKGLKLSNDYNK